MVSGAVTVQVLENPTAATVSAALTAMRVNNNSKYLMTSIHNGKGLILAHIEE